MTTNRKIQIMCSTAHNTKRKTQTGIPAINHAHPPLARIRKKGVRNGMALVSKAIEKEEPERLVSRFAGREIRLPDGMERFPSQVALEWHRGEVFG